jgi:hypothetical protein
MSRRPMVVRVSWTREFMASRLPMSAFMAWKRGEAVEETVLGMEWSSLRTSSARELLFA